MPEKGVISIWFFIGVLLAVYGILILGSGLAELSGPPARVVVLANLHAAIWWGALTLGLGVAYILKFRPGQR